MEGFEKAIPLISVLIAGGALWVAYKNRRRDDTKDTKQDAMQLSRIEAGVENLSKTMEDIRVEMRVQRADLNDHERRITRIEARCELKGEQHAE